MATTEETLVASTEAAQQEISDWHCRLFDLVVHGVFGSLVVIFGLVGNGLTMVIMGREKKNTTTNRLLTLLAATDGLILLFGGPYSAIRAGLDMIGSSSFAKNVTIIFSYMISYNATRFLNTISTYLTILIGCHRYLSVCHPHQVKILCTNRNIRLYIVSSIILSVLLNIPIIALIYRIRRLPFGFFTIDVTPFFYSKANAIIQIITFAINFGIPFVLLIYMAIRITHALTNLAKVSSSTDKSAPSRSLTLSILLVIIVFILCRLPDAVFGIIGQTLSNIYEDTRCHGSLFYFGHMPALISYINSSANIIIYTLCLRGFRKQLVASLGIRGVASIAPLGTEEETSPH